MRFRFLGPLAFVWPVQMQAQACPSATDSELLWIRQSSAAFGVSVAAPLSFRVQDWSSRTDTTSQLFSLWRDAATRVEFFSPTNRRSTALRDAVGTRCTLQSALGPLQLKTWISLGKQYNGRDTTYYNAGGEVALDGKKPMLVHVIAHDSVTLLLTLQVLKTLKRRAP